MIACNVLSFVVGAIFIFMVIADFVGSSHGDVYVGFIVASRTCDEFLRVELA